MLLALLFSLFAEVAPAAAPPVRKMNIVFDAALEDEDAMVARFAAEVLEMIEPRARRAA